ncbi:MAG: transcription antitermination factor NusB [Spirochaetes bacterium]|nr:transcription antitermination factor NusB [Spirochaetota bacterium]
MNINYNKAGGKNSKYLVHRREGRIIAFQALFAYDFTKKSIDELLKFDWLENECSNESLDYAKFLIKGTIENIELIDSKINSRLRNWDFDRISIIDKSILRFSIYSLIFEKNLSKNIIINEAIEIVKLYGTQDSYKFVNGILDAIKKSEEQSK